MPFFVLPQIKVAILSLADGMTSSSEHWTKTISLLSTHDGPPNANPVDRREPRAELLYVFVSVTHFSLKRVAAASITDLAQKKEKKKRAKK